MTNYGHWKLPDDDRFCTANRGLEHRPSEYSQKVRTYCIPTSIKPARHFLYRNNGDRTFTDVTEAAGVARTDGRGFAVVAADLNGDGRIDLYVANDMCPNFVFLNRGDGTFEDFTETSGAGYDGHGQTRSGMGVDAEDVDGDGLPDLLVTNLFNESTSLYRNLGAGLFEYRTPTSGMATDSAPWVGWGCALADFDNDGWPDCFVSTGHVDDNLELLGKNSPYAQPPLLHRNLEGRRFRLATRDAGAYFDSGHVGRGAAFGDLDNDGDVDIVVNHKDGVPALLRNDTTTANHWIRLSLVGTLSNRDAVGALVTVELKSRTLFRQRKGGGSLESSHDPRLLIGLGEETEARRVTIRWPSGGITTAEHLAADTSYRVVEPHDKVRQETRDAFQEGRSPEASIAAVVLENGTPSDARIDDERGSSREPCRALDHLPGMSRFTLPDSRPWLHTASSPLPMRACGFVGSLSSRRLLDVAGSSGPTFRSPVTGSVHFVRAVLENPLRVP